METKRVRRWKRERITLEPPSAFPPNREIREGDARPLPKRQPDMVTRIPPDAPRPGQSRYRLEQRGEYLRVAEWRRGLFGWTAPGWRYFDGPWPECDRQFVMRKLNRLRHEELNPVPHSSWQPVPEDQP